MRTIKTIKAIELRIDILSLNNFSCSIQKSIFFWIDVPNVFLYEEREWIRIWYYGHKIKKYKDRSFKYEYIFNMR